MAAPVSLKNSDSLDIDTSYDSGGTAGAVLGLTGRSAGGITPPLQPQAVGTHSQGDTFNATDPVAVIGGVDNSGLAQPVYLDADGFIGGVAAQPRQHHRCLGHHRHRAAWRRTSWRPARAARYLLIQNTDPGEDMWIDFGTDAVASRTVLPHPGGRRVHHGRGLHLDGPGERHRRHDRASVHARRWRDMPIIPPPAVRKVSDGSTTVASIQEIEFTAGATVSNLGGGVAGVAVTASGSTGPTGSTGRLARAAERQDRRRPTGTGDTVAGLDRPHRADRSGRATGPTGSTGQRDYGRDRATGPGGGATGRPATGADGATGPTGPRGRQVRPARQARAATGGGASASVVTGADRWSTRLARRGDATGTGERAARARRPATWPIGGRLARRARSDATRRDTTSRQRRRRPRRGVMSVAGVRRRRSLGATQTLGRSASVGPAGLTAARDLVCGVARGPDTSSLILAPVRILRADAVRAGPVVHLRCVRPGVTTEGGCVGTTR